MPPAAASKGASTESRNGKSKPSKIVVLSISSVQLEQFPHEKTPSKPSSTKSPTSEPSLNLAGDDAMPTPEVKVEKKGEVEVEPSTDTPINGQIPTTEGSKRKGPGLKAGQKRNAVALTDGQPKMRGKPGPKKRKL